MGLFGRFKLPRRREKAAHVACVLWGLRGGISSSSAVRVEFSIAKKGPVLALRLWGLSVGPAYHASGADASSTDVILTTFVVTFAVLMFQL